MAKGPPGFLPTWNRTSADEKYISPGALAHILSLMSEAYKTLSGSLDPSGLPAQSLAQVCEDEADDDNPNAQQDTVRRLKYAAHDGEDHRPHDSRRFNDRDRRKGHEHDGNVYEGELEARGDPHGQNIREVKL